MTCSADICKPYWLIRQLIHYHDYIDRQAATQEFPQRHYPNPTARSASSVSPAWMPAPPLRHGGLNLALVYDLATDPFVAQREDALFLGPPRTG
jgi:hypothetical protein